MYKGDEKNVTDFYSYDEPVYAPADGRVTEVVDGLESDIMGNRDTKNPGGNHIILDIGNNRYVYFGHFKKGSIAVEEGQIVSAGELLARVGNSGNSTHPHLHMHIQNKPSSDPEGRSTYPFRFKNIRRKRLIFWQEINNAALLRNDLFSSKS
jgi:murein DD-endopeptidase MepM/ murein hydrolase activator NlpD